MAGFGYACIPTEGTKKITKNRTTARINAAACLKIKPKFGGYFTPFPARFIRQKMGDNLTAKPLPIPAGIRIVTPSV